MSKKAKGKFNVQSDCPFCGEEVGWSQMPQLRKRVICNACQGVSEVVSLSPLELDEPSWPAFRSGSPKEIWRQTRKKSAQAFLEYDEWEADDPFLK